MNRELTILRAMFYHGFDDYTPPKVSRVPKFPEKAIAYNFGFRRAELLGLRVDQIDLQNRTISLWTGETKSGQGRKVVMTQEVLQLVKPQIDGKQPKDFVFTWPNGDPVLDFRGAWGKMCASAGVSVLLHDFRRSAVRNMTRAGISREVAKKISGHLTDSIFSRYKHHGRERSCGRCGEDAGS